MGLSRAVSETDGDFSRKSQDFPTHPLYFAPTLKGFTFELGIGAGGHKTRVMSLPARTRCLTISSAIWIQSANVTDRQTDGRTDTGRQQRPRLRIASRGKNPRNLQYSQQKFRQSFVFVTHTIGIGCPPTCVRTDAMISYVSPMTFQLPRPACRSTIHYTS